MSKFIKRFDSFLDSCDALCHDGYAVVAHGINTIIDACGGIGELTSEKIDRVCEIVVGVCGFTAALIATVFVVGPFIVIGYVSRKFND